MSELICPHCGEDLKDYGVSTRSVDVDLEYNNGLFVVKRIGFFGDTLKCGYCDKHISFKDAFNVTSTDVTDFSVGARTQTVRYGNVIKTISGND